MLKITSLISSFILVSLIGLSQEEIGDSLTVKERAFSDSIAAINAVSAVNAAAMSAYNDGIQAFQAKNYDIAIQNFDKAIAGIPDLSWKGKKCNYFLRQSTGYRSRKLQILHKKRRMLCNSW